MASDELNKLFNVLNEINNKEGYLTTVRTTNLSNELFETLKIIENCTSRKYNEFHKLINEVENLLFGLEKEKEEQGKRKIIDKLNYKLMKIDDELNTGILCESCKGKKIEKLTDKYGNEEIARFLYDSKLDYIEWIPFNEFRN